MSFRVVSFCTVLISAVPVVAVITAAHEVILANISFGWKSVQVAYQFKRSFYAYASQYSLGLILTEVARDITEIATEKQY